MPGINITGKPNTDDYNLGRGIIYLAALDANDVPGAWRDVGNATEFNLNIESETLEHQASRQGLKVVDKEVELSRKINASFVLDEINFENLAAFLSSSGAASYANADAIAGVAVAVVLDATVELGRWYDLVDSDGNRIYDIDAADLELVETAGPTTLVEGTDYEVDEVMGRVLILSTASNIAAGESLQFTLAAKAEAETVDEVEAFTATSVQVALKFISNNPADNGKRTEYMVHKITLKADGDYALIGDDWTTMGFTGALESNADGKTLTVRTPKGQA